MAKRYPFLKFFVDDWLAEERLRLCSLAARGLWIDLLCVMHKCDRRGYLMQANGQPYSLAQLARLTGCGTDEAAHLCRELLTSGVASVTPDGIMFSRRMLRDEEISEARSLAGKKGGNPLLLSISLSKPPSKSLVSGRLDSSSGGEECSRGGCAETAPAENLAAATRLVEAYQRATATAHDPSGADAAALLLLSSGAADEAKLAAAVDKFGKHARKTYRDPSKRMSARRFFSESWRHWINGTPIADASAPKEDIAALAERVAKQRQQLEHVKRPIPVPKPTKGV